MTEVLIALGVLLVMGVIVFALLRVAPRHDKEVDNAFEELAMRHGLRHQAEDDGRVRQFADYFDGIGEPRSASAGGSNARDVVSGVLDGQRIFVFRQGTEHSEGAAPVWFVAGLELKDPLADRCSIQFCHRGSDPTTTLLADPIVKQLEIGAFNVVIRAPDTSSAGRLLEDEVLQEITSYAEKVAFRPELQLRGRRVVAYPADRGTTVDHANDLDRLLGLAQRTTRIAA